MELLLLVLFVLWIYTKIDDHNVSNKNYDKFDKANKEYYSEKNEEKRLQDFLKKNPQQETKEKHPEETKKKRYHRNDYSSWLAKKAKHLKSQKWKNLRNKRLIKDNYACVVCSKNGTVNLNDRLECHHLSYENLGKEPLKDLRMVCRSHHQQIHDKHGYSRYGHFPVD